MAKKAQPTDLIFKLEHQFTLYLQRSGVTRGDLPPDQYREMRRAFYGGCGQMFFLVTQDVLELKEAGINQVMNGFVDQVQQFWTKQQEVNEKGMEEYAASMKVGCECGWSGVVSDLLKPEPGAEDDRCRCPKCNSLELKVPS